MANRKRSHASAAASAADDDEPNSDPIIIAVFNFKGGVGKTSVTTMLADAFVGAITVQGDGVKPRLPGKTVVLIDADPQCNLSSYYLRRDTSEDELDDDESGEDEESDDDEEEEASLDNRTSAVSAAAPGYREFAVACDIPVTCNPAESWSTSYPSPSLYDGLKPIFNHDATGMTGMSPISANGDGEQPEAKRKTAQHVIHLVPVSVPRSSAVQYRPCSTREELDQAEPFDAEPDESMRETRMREDRRQHRRGNLYLVRGDPRIAEFFSKIDLDTTFRGAFRVFAQRTARKCNADVVIVDVGPSVDDFNRNVVMSADYVLPPACPDGLTLASTKALFESVLPTFFSWKKSKSKAASPEDKKTEFFHKRLPKILPIIVNKYKLGKPKAPRKGKGKSSSSKRRSTSEAHTTIGKAHSPYVCGYRQLMEDETVPLFVRSHLLPLPSWEVGLSGRMRSMVMPIIPDLGANAVVNRNGKCGTETAALNFYRNGVDTQPTKSARLQLATFVRTLLEEHEAAQTSRT